MVQKELVALEITLGEASAVNEATCTTPIPSFSAERFINGEANPSTPELLVSIYLNQFIHILFQTQLRRLRVEIGKVKEHNAACETVINVGDHSSPLFLISEYQGSKVEDSNRGRKRKCGNNNSSKVTF